MKPILIGAVVAGVLVAVVLLVFRPESDGDLTGDGSESAIATVETLLELVPENNILSS